MSATEESKRKSVESVLADRERQEGETAQEHADRLRREELSRPATHRSGLEARRRRAERDAQAECPGHPAGEFDPMGETVFCDGSCQKGLR